MLGILGPASFVQRSLSRRWIALMGKQALPKTQGCRIQRIAVGSVSTKDMQVAWCKTSIDCRFQIIGLIGKLRSALNIFGRTTTCLLGPELHPPPSRSLHSLGQYGNKYWSGPRLACLGYKERDQGMGSLSLGQAAEAGLRLVAAFWLGSWF